MSPQGCAPWRSRLRGELFPWTWRSFTQSRTCCRNAALAFGNGIPGYDINEKARDAQRKAIKDELGEQKELARLEKEKRRAARAAEEAAAEAARTETTD